MPKPEVRALDEIPQPGGVAMPAVRADEHRVVLAYVTRFTRQPESGGAPMLVGRGEHGSCCVVDFDRPLIHTSGFPNDEVQYGHPLRVFGLGGPHGVFEVLNSPWLDAMRAIEQVHSSPLSFSDRRHFVFTFQDSMFECIAKGMRLLLRQGTVDEALEAVWRGADDPGDPA